MKDGELLVKTFFSSFSHNRDLDLGSIYFAGFIAGLLVIERPSSALLQDVKTLKTK